MSVTEKFGCWLSGLIDGEGCFVIIRRIPKDKKRRVAYSLQFSLSLRKDDRPILEKIHGITGIGIVAPSQGGMWIWRFGGIHDAVKLIGILDRYPLRTRKSRDYLLWRQAAEAIIAHKRGESWGVVSDLKTAMEWGRSSHVCD